MLHRLFYQAGAVQLWGSTTSVTEGPTVLRCSTRLLLNQRYGWYQGGVLMTPDFYLGAMLLAFTALLTWTWYCDPYLLRVW